MNSDTKKIIIAGATVVVLALGTALVVSAVKKKRFQEGRDKRNRDFNPNKQYKVAYVGEQGYANIRSSKTAQGGNIASLSGLWDSWTMDTKELADKYENNLIGKVNTGMIGTVINESADSQGHYWYLVNLTVPLKGKTKGYVRSDVVRIEYKNK